MAAVETYPERYANPAGFAREVNLPLLGTAHVRPVPAGAGLAQLLESSSGSEALAPVVDSLMETRRSLTLRSLLVAGFAHDPECFSVGLSIAREWSRRNLRVAVVDLDFWNPTISRPPSHPNEGLVDVLEYGCSFGRVAWEIAADRLWMIGPGSHPPDESRIAEHPDWVRAGRVFASCVDVVLYVAPLLDRRGLTGKLSKRMDAVLLAASTDRIGRADLRDAFLELWGSDAPMIGCVGIEPTDARSATRRAERAPEVHAFQPPAVTASAGSARTAASPGAMAPAAPSASPAPAAPSAPPALDSVAGIAPAPAFITPHPRVQAALDDEAGSVRELRPPPRREPVASGVDEVEAALERDVRRGIVEKKAAPGRRNPWLWIGAAAALALVAGGLSAFLANRDLPPRGSIEATQPAGEEPIGTAPSEEAGNLDNPSVRSEEPGGARRGSEEIGSVTALGKEIEGAPAVAPPSPPAGSTQAQRAGLGTGAGTGALPSVGTTPDAGKPFRVHVASFRTEAKVREIVDGLKAKKLDAWFEPPPAGGSWYRVFVGRFATEAEAATYAQWLVKTGAVDRAQSYPQTKR